MIFRELRLASEIQRWGKRPPKSRRRRNLTRDPNDIRNVSDLGQIPDPNDWHIALNNPDASGDTAHGEAQGRRRPLQRRDHSSVYPRGHPLIPEDDPSLAALAGELNGLSDTHSRVTDVTDAQTAKSAHHLARYRMRSLDALMRATKAVRKYFGSICGKLKRAFREIAFIAYLCDRLPVYTHIEIADAEVRRTDVDIPRNPAVLAPGLTGFLGLYRADQAMCNWVARDVANGMSDIPAYLLYPSPLLRSRPWFPDETDRDRDLGEWKKHPEQAKKRIAPKGLSIQAWLLYHLCFLPDAQTCRDCAEIGGLAPKLNLLAISRNMDVPGSVNLAISYFRILSARFAEGARQRSCSSDDFVRLLSAEQIDLGKQARRERALSSKETDGPPAPPAGRPPWALSLCAH